MKLWPGSSPLDPRIATLVKQNAELVELNIALVDKLRSALSKLAVAEAPAREPLKGVAGGRGGPLPNYSPEFWRSDEAAEIQNDGTVVVDQEAIDAAEQALRESFRASLKEAR